MTNLPNCKLCGSKPTIDLEEENNTAWCSNDCCPLHDGVFSFEDWIKLNTKQEILNDQELTIAYMCVMEKAKEGVLNPKKPKEGME